MQQMNTMVLGAGLMGIGIATHFARHGRPVLLYDTDPARLADVPATAGSILAELAAAGLADPQESAATLARLHTTNELAQAASAQLLIEAIPERLALKHALYAQLEALIAHFWNPPHLIPLVEIVPGSATEPRHLATIERLLTALDLEAVVLDRAAPGFVGNRLQFALLREALHIVQSGIASPQVVDQVMRASLGRRYAMVGPLEAADMTGLDTVADIARHLLPTLAAGDGMMTLVQEKVEQGQTGLRSGDGFYCWDDARRTRIAQRRTHQLRFALKP